MQSREELHKLVGSMPEAAIETAHRFLSALQVWPPRPPIDRGKQITMTEVRTAAGTRAGFSRRDGDTYVVETHRSVRGCELTIVERLRVDGEQVIYTRSLGRAASTTSARLRSSLRNAHNSAMY
jgi:hypothetical protein